MPRRRFSRQRATHTFRQGTEAPFLLDELVERDQERRLRRFEREQDRLQAEAEREEREAGRPLIRRVSLWVGCRTH